MIDISAALQIAQDHYPAGPEAVAKQLVRRIRRSPLRMRGVVYTRKRFTCHPRELYLTSC